MLPDGSGLLFDPITEAGHVLNAVGALAWDFCDGALSAEAIADEIAALVPGAPTLRADILALLTEFAQGGLLVGTAPAPPVG